MRNTKNNVLTFSQDLRETLTNQLNARRDNVLIIICQQGQFQLMLDQTNYQVQAGEMIVCRPEVILSNFAQSDNCRCLIAIADPLALNELVFGCLRNSKNWVGKMHFFVVHPQLKLTDRQLRLLEAFQQIFIIYSESDPTPYACQIQRTFAQAAVYEMLSWLDTEVDKMQPPHTGMVSERSMNVFRRFMGLLEDKRGSERSVQWYATELNITPKYLTHICKQVINKTALDLITDITCHEIRQQLLGSDESIKEIAYRLNFPNLTFFSKYTRQHLGMTPSAVRKFR